MKRLNLGDNYKTFIMKKTLLTLSLFASFFSFSQVLQSENFDALTLGDVGTDVTGVTAGQGGYYTANGTNASYQIVSETTGKSLQITGSNTATGSRFMWKDGLVSAWAGRTSGNEVINIEFDLFTGGATTSKNRQNLYLYNAAGDRVLVGLSFVAETKTLLGVCYLDNAGTFGNYSLNLGASPIVLSGNQWVRIGMSFNKTTGEVFWKGPGFYGSFDGAAAGSDPAEIDYIMSSGTANAVAYTGKFDNLVSWANNVENLLGTNDFEVNKLDLITLYPNPTTSILNISNNNNLDIKNISVVDINGRVVKNQEGSLTQINVSDLNAGVYFVTIEAAEGKTTKKFIKQ